jgi:hypothetical protein
MKKLILFLILIALVGVGGWTLGYGLSVSNLQHQPRDPNGLLYWLRDEYHLSTAQFATIKELYRQNEPHARLLADQTRKAYEELSESLRASPQDNNLITQKAQSYVKAKDALKRSHQSHIEAVAAVMSPDQSERFLQEVKGHLRD